MSEDLISRKEVVEALRARGRELLKLGTSFETQIASVTALECVNIVKDAPAVDAEPVITGETSDGYHTFNELYHHRAVLFSVIVKAFPEKAWKAKKHDDGSMYDGMFIVGIETPDGQATYHYDIDPYWEMFKCRELEYAPKWDGHTPQEAIERIGKLEPVRHGRWKSVKEPGKWGYTAAMCSACGLVDHSGTFRYFNYCPNCGAKMDKEAEK